MRIKLLKVIFILGILVLIPIAGRPAEDRPARDRIVLATLDWPPYVGRTMDNQGYVTAIVKEAFGRSGVTADIRFHRWSRVIGLVKRGQVDGYFPEYYNDEIRSYARFSDPMPAGPLGFFKRSDSQIEFTELKELSHLRIGIVKGYVNSAAFDAATFLNKHPVNDDLSNFRLLLAGRVDLVVADRYVGEYLLAHHLPEHWADVTFLHHILEQKQIYLCIRSGRDNTLVFLNTFNRGLQEMQADGTLDRLLPSRSRQTAP